MSGWHRQNILETVPTTGFSRANVPYSHIYLTLKMILSETRKFCLNMHSTKGEAVVKLLSNFLPANPYTCPLLLHIHLCHEILPIPGSSFHTATSFIPRVKHWTTRFSPKNFIFKGVFNYRPRTHTQRIAKVLLYFSLILVFFHSER